MQGKQGNPEEMIPSFPPLAKGGVGGFENVSRFDIRISNLAN